jgi:ABC-type nitrate/sulfonate/bicarbonate transport system ATPase subunit
MIEICNLTKTYADENQEAVTALKSLALTIQPGEFVAILGPSGCGKTTLLRLIAGLLLPDAGEVRVHGKPVTGPGPDRALVFQNFALLPWADVLTNVAFGLEIAGMPRAERLARAAQYVAAVGLQGFERSYPRQLSGGMQQRVGLARALAVDPAILLMDEPFGALDAQTRRLMQEDLLALHDRSPRTVVFVTHSMDEAVRLADRVVLLTLRPGQVKEALEVPFGRPRRPDFDKDPRFIELIDHLWEALRAMQPAVKR